MTVAIFALCLCVGSGSGGLGDDDRRKIVADAKLDWDSLSSLEFTCEEAVPGAGGSIDPSAPFTRYEYRSGGYGRRSFKSFSVYPDGRLAVTKWFREDGKTRHDITPFSTDPASISIVTTRNELNTQAEYNDTMFSCMWFLYPAGLNVATWLERCQELKRISDGGRELIELNGRHPKNNRPIRMMIDPVNTLTALKVDIGSGKMARHWQADELATDNGRWFPARGSFTATTTAGPAVYTFKVAGLKINRPIASGEFAPPRILDGVAVQDQRSGENYIKGGVEAQKKLRARYLPAGRVKGGAEAAVRAEGGVAGDPLVAAESRGQASRLVPLLIISIAVVAGSAILVKKSRRA